jgi:hypothetical protein
MQAIETYRSERLDHLGTVASVCYRVLVGFDACIFLQNTGGGHRASQLLKSTTYSPRTHEILKDGVCPTFRSGRSNQNKLNSLRWL